MIISSDDLNLRGYGKVQKKEETFQGLWLEVVIKVKVWEYLSYCLY